MPGRSGGWLQALNRKQRLHLYADPSIAHGALYVRSKNVARLYAALALNAVCGERTLSRGL